MSFYPKHKASELIGVVFLASSLLLTLSDIAMAAGESITGIDINPLVATAEGDLVALDASVYLAG